MNIKDGNRGWTQTEMICSLVVMAIISIGAFWGYEIAHFKYRIIKMTSLVADLASNIQTKFMGYPDYMGLSTVKIKDMNIVPADLKYNKAQALHHYFGGRLDVFKVDNEKDGIPAQYFAIRMQNLPAKVCFELASMKWENNLEAGLLSMEIIAKPNEYLLDQMEIAGENCAGVDADLFAAQNRGYALVCKDGSRQSFPIMPRYAWKACNCSADTCMMTWVYK